MQGSESRTSSPEHHQGAIKGASTRKSNAEADVSKGLFWLQYGSLGVGGGLPHRGHQHSEAVAQSHRDAEAWEWGWLGAGRKRGLEERCVKGR